MSRASSHPFATPGYYTFDLGAPVVAGTYDAAKSAADVALTAAELLLSGESAVYALCRPPGHHAGSDISGGYCYFNNAAIAAEYILNHVSDREPSTATAASHAYAGHDSKKAGERSVSPVVILDIDAHHGNGTQQIFYARADVMVLSLHGDPASEYPYFSGYADEVGVDQGRGYNINIPLPLGTEDAKYIAELDNGLRAIAAVCPRFLVVSAGFDTCEHDPVGKMALSSDAYPTIGRRIAELKVPTMFVQEGGYDLRTLGASVVGLLTGYQSG